jgi:glycosyltransferase involved in cell wall biosynthesis
MPPPVTGFRLVNTIILAALRQRAHVEVFDRAREEAFDTAPRTGRRRAQLVQLKLALRFCATSLRRRNARLYMGLSGGMGQLIDLIYLAMSRLLRHPIFIHHHSFSYINTPTTLSRLVFRLTRAQTHVLLSQGMADALIRQYELTGAKTLVISNAAYFSDDSAGAADAGVGVAANGPLRIGYLSNITFDKGFVEFFGVLQRLNALGVRYEARIGGPVAPDARQTFDELCASTPDVRHLGPLYDAAKDQFFRELDLLLFPTRYVNEAEPLVIHEALRCGVFTLACRRGAIAEVLQNGAGEVFAESEFVESAAACVRALDADRAALAQKRVLAVAQARRLRAQGQAGLATLLAAVTD